MIAVSIKRAYWVDDYNDPLLSSDISSVCRIVQNGLVQEWRTRFRYRTWHLFMVKVYCSSL